MAVQCIVSLEVISRIKLFSGFKFPRKFRRNTVEKVRGKQTVWERGVCTVRYWWTDCAVMHKS